MKTYTTGDVASYCDVNFRTVIRWIERGWLAAHKLPGRGDNRIREEDLVAFLRRHELPIPREVSGANRVLIVDDEPAMVRAIDRVLRREGFETASAADGFHAGTQLANFKPGLMTLDLQMPGIDGFSVLNLIKADKRYDHVKVLVISGLPAPSLKKAMGKGACAVLRKPFSDSELREAVNVLLRSND